MLKRAAMGALGLFVLWAMLQILVFGMIAKPILGLLVVAVFFAIWLTLQGLLLLALRLLRR